MKKCNECNVLMINNCKIEGQHPFEIGTDGSSDISLIIPINEKDSFLGMKYDKIIEKQLYARFCPNCGKVEFYINVK